MIRHIYGAPRGLPLSVLANPFGHTAGQAGRCGVKSRLLE
jgi:hypothetical protein